MLFALLPAYMIASHFATPSEGKWDFAPANPTIYLSGHVLAVTEFAITVAPNEGKVGVKTVPFHNRLAMGSYNLLECAGFAYSRTDVKPGDIVILRNMTFNKILFCISMSICERPGEKVPPSRKYWKGEYQPYHHMAEACLAWHKNKVELPYHLHPLTKPENFPAFDRGISKKDRLKPFPEERPFSYIGYLIFMR